MVSVGVGAIGTWVSVAVFSVVAVVVGIGVEVGSAVCGVSVNVGGSIVVARAPRSVGVAMTVGGTGSGGVARVRGLTITAIRTETQIPSKLITSPISKSPRRQCRTTCTVNINDRTEKMMVMSQRTRIQIIRCSS